MLDKIRAWFASPEQKLARAALRQESVPIADRFERVAEQLPDNPTVQLTQVAAQSSPTPDVLYKMALESLAQASGPIAGLAAQMVLHTSDPGPVLRHLDQTFLERLEPTPEQASRALERIRDGVTDGYELARVMGIEAPQLPHAVMVEEMIRKTRFTGSDEKLRQRAQRQGAPVTTAELARVASELVDVALATHDVEGKWVDEKTPVAAVALKHLALTAGDVGTRRFAETAAKLVQDLKFSSSSEAVAREAFRALQGDLTPADQAAAFLRMTRAALACEDTSYRYKDDKTPVARAAAELLSGCGDPELARIARLARAALSGSQFTVTNEAIAAAAFGGERDAFRAVKAMVAGALNAENSSYKWQPDKCTVISNVLPVLRQECPGRATELWAAVEADHVAFADSSARIADRVLSGSPDPDDQALGRLCVGFLQDAHAGETSSYAYKDDKTAVALRAAAYLAGNAATPEARQWAVFLQKSLDQAAFTTSCTAVAEEVFQQIARGRAPGAQEQAAVARRMVSRAYAGETSSYKYEDDKTQVARNVTAQLRARTDLTEGQRRSVELLHEAMQRTTYTTSNAALAEVVFGSFEHVDVMQLIRAGTVTSDKQDQGPIAVGVFAALTRLESGAARKDEFVTAHGMMDTGVDYRVRVQVAERILQGQSPVEAVSGLDSEAVSQLLVAGIRKLASTRGGDAVGVAEASIAAAHGDVEALKEALRRLPNVEQEVKQFVEAAQAPGGAVEEKPEFVMVGGVRLKKAR